MFRERAFSRNSDDSILDGLTNAKYRGANVEYKEREREREVSVERRVEVENA